MKKLLDVEKTRSEQHADNQRNSVHRSSLLVPVLPNSEVSISLLNHFLIKRNIPSVGCKVTAIDKNGKRLISQLTTIDEPRVYTMHLQRNFGANAASFLVEFFSSNNIFIPFPAVMVNHRTLDAASGVHSFNRVLADVFEDDDVNAIHVQEAAIDITQDPNLSTFFVLAAGPYNLQTPVALRLSSRHSELYHSLNVNIPRFTQQMFKLNDIVPEWSQLQGTLFINQPDQKLFYGRLFVGQIAKDESFVGNHSYYDSSHVEGEFWNNNDPSFRTYPVIKELDALIRFYPIMSPSALKISVIFNSAAGESLGKTAQRVLISPSQNNFELDIRKSALDVGVDINDVNSFTVHALPVTGNTPTRINHQIVYRQSAIESSINISLQNYNVLHSKSKSRTSWGQIINSLEFDTWLSITNDGYEDPISTVEVKLFDENGYVGSESIDVPKRTASTINISTMLLRNHFTPKGEFLWYEIESPNYFLTAFSISRNIKSNHCTGEHSF
jgi:hypothetical protein